MVFNLTEDIMFNAVIWANSLMGTGNTRYQNKFYDNQAQKIQTRYEGFTRS